MGEQTVSRAERPASEKQRDYIKLLRKRLHKVFGSQTPPEFMDTSLDLKHSIVSATILITAMKKMLHDGTPPVREESACTASNSEGSGYEEEPSAPGSFISIFQAPLPDPGPMEYWGWTWTCSHSVHATPMHGGVERQTAAFLSAMQHWGKYHLRKD